MSTLKRSTTPSRFWARQDLVLLHATQHLSRHKLDELNLAGIPTLRERYGVPVGYSGHEVGLATTVAAVALGACMIERHITLDRAMWGSDQAASVEPQGFSRLVRDTRAVEPAMGDGVSASTTARCRSARSCGGSESPNHWQGPRNTRCEAERAVL